MPLSRRLLSSVCGMTHGGRYPASLVRGSAKKYNEYEAADVAAAVQADAAERAPTWKE